MPRNRIFWLSNEGAGRCLPGLLGSLPLESPGMFVSVKLRRDYSWLRFFIWVGIILGQIQPRGTGAPAIYQASREETDRYVPVQCFGHLVSLFSFCF
jgi:hypothetical protein